MENYTLRLFFNGLQGNKPKPPQERMIEASCPTEAITKATTDAQMFGADHFNINLGIPEYEEETFTTVSRKK